MNSVTSSPSEGERLWRTTFFILSAIMAAWALVDFDAGRLSKGLGGLGVALLMLSLMVRFPFLRALVKASADKPTTPEKLRKQREDLLQQAENLRAANPWADHAGRAGWVLLGISLVLRVSGGA